MSVENVTKFYNEVMKDEQLKGKLKDVNEKTLTEEVFKSRVLPEAKAKGYDFTYADAKEYYKKQGGMTELNLDEMEDVAGGGCKTPPQVKSPESQQSRSCSYYTAHSQKPKEESTCNDCTHLRQEQNYYVCDLGL